MNKARHLVSQKKLRTVDASVPHGGVDLDLVEIHSGVVCMGYPATGVEALYRNKYKDVLRYLDYKYKSEYMVYNLCREAAYQYASDRFHGRVRCFPFYDHAAAPLRLMPAFVRDAQDYLGEHPGGVVVIHCKAGKGRTGVMACCLLLAREPSFALSAEAVIKYYGAQRTKDGKGLTVPSQIRSVEYYARLLRDYGGEVPETVPTIALRSIRLQGMPPKHQPVEVRFFVDGAEEPCCVAGLVSSCNRFHVDRTYTVTERGKRCSAVTLTCDSEPRLRALRGDLRIEFVAGAEGKSVFVLSVNTLFLESRYSGKVVDSLNKLCEEQCYIEFDYTVL